MSLEELIQACAENGDAAAWEEFVKRFHDMIAAVVLRTAQRWRNVSTALVDDLIQETYLKICGDRMRLLSEFQPHHPEAFYGYLKVITANVVHDYFRAQHSHKRGSGRTETSIDEPFSDMPATVSVGEDIHRQILLKEVDAALCAGTPDEKQARDRIIFWLYYRYGLTAQAIARLPSISLTVKGVESVIHKLTRSVRERLAERDNALHEQ
jgi:RNA polymerase sigma-70 factor (ECF subfamily)